MKHRTLSNKERIYKNKIIAEYHIRKDGQNFIDNYLQDKSLTYKEAYLNNDLLHNILIQYNFSKLSRAMKGVGTSCERATQVLKNFQMLSVDLTMAY